MLSPITIYSSSAADSDGFPPLNPEDFDYGEEEDWHREYGQADLGESYTDRPPKKPRVRGPDGIAHDEPSFGPLASLGSNHQSLQDANATAPVANDIDPLLTQILEIFPDIQHSYVNDLITRHMASLQTQMGVQANAVDLALCRDAVYEEILLHPYPKQKEQPKRKRKDSYEGEDKWENNTLYQTEAQLYARTALDMLSGEFLFIPKPHIRKVLIEKKRLYHTFLALFSDENHLEQSKNSFIRLRKSRMMPRPTRPSSLYDILTRELSAATQQAAKLEDTFRKKQQEEEVEKANEEEYTRQGNLIECQCCYGDAPANRCIPCEGDDLHFFCFTCIRRSAETQIGLMKYELKCFDVSGCQADFARPDLLEVLGSSLMEKLDALQQDDEIRKAGLDGLEDCPFCEYKAILPSVEEDREFRCENPACKSVSCRLCKEKTHIPLTCEESRKDKGLSERHEVEEAMSKALIRNCPKCQVKIVKEYGCNKMYCPQCRTAMCYLCQKDITTEGYGHFASRGGCSQDDSQREREEREIQQAEKAAIQKILTDNPDMTEAELRVKHPEARNHRPDPNVGYNMPMHHHMMRPQAIPLGNPEGQLQGINGHPVYNYPQQPPAQIAYYGYNNVQQMAEPNFRPFVQGGVAQGAVQIGHPAAPPAQMRAMQQGLYTNPFGPQRHNQAQAPLPMNNLPPNNRPGFPRAPQQGNNNPHYGFGNMR
ncbi:hypothetical protein BJX99DRAFT_102003 [Aspergillus californicus]